MQAGLFSVPDWKGRILVDATNRVTSYSPLTLGDISGRTSSEIFADLARGAKVVKAFNPVPMSWISDFSATKPRTVLFISGDDDDAKKPLSDLIEQVGVSCIDLGTLAVGGRLQQLGGPLAAVRLPSPKGSRHERPLQTLVDQGTKRLEDGALKRSASRLMRLQT